MLLSPLCFCYPIPSSEFTPPPHTTIAATSTPSVWEESGFKQLTKTAIFVLLPLRSPYTGHRVKTLVYQPCPPLRCSKIYLRLQATAAAERTALESRLAAVAAVGDVSAARLATLEQAATDAARERDALAAQLNEIQVAAAAAAAAAAAEGKSMETRLQVRPASLRGGASWRACAVTAVFFRLAQRDALLLFSTFKGSAITIFNTSAQSSATVHLPL